MSDTSNTVIIRVLDKEYQVSCPPEEREALMRSADDLDARMREIRKSGNVIGLERIAVMAALNLAHELTGAESRAASGAGLGEEITRLDEKLSQALFALDSSAVGSS